MHELLAAANEPYAHAKLMPQNMAAMRKLKQVQVNMAAMRKLKQVQVNMAAMRKLKQVQVNAWTRGWGFIYHETVTFNEKVYRFWRLSLFSSNELVENS